MQQQRFKLNISFNYAVIPESMVSKRVVVALIAADINWFHVTQALNYRLHMNHENPGISKKTFFCS